jgi:hypothetical protein
MSKLEVNAIEPQSGTTLTLGASGDTITIPAGATISNSGTAAGFGPTGAVSWNTTKITANPNPAVTGVGYFADTTSAAFTITLPATPAAGAVIGIADYANTFATNNITVGRNGSNIAGSASNAVLSTNGVSVTFVYVDATQGWIVTDSGNRSDLPQPTFIVATGGTILTCGNFKTHVFTGPGTFTVCSVGNPVGSNSVEYLVVAGGGGGGEATSTGGGGGAGGYRQNYPSPTSAGLPVAAQGYPITVGGGGPGSSVLTPGTSGNPSVFSTITSTGGGGGAGGSESPAATRNGLPGGSGGGATYGTGSPAPVSSVGSGNTPPVSPSQGNPGGLGAPQSALHAAGGGGGASAAGTAGNNPTTAGPGGIGTPIATAFFGPTAPSYGTSGPAPGRYFAGGGGGGSQCGTNTQGTGGSGGGGQGGAPAPNTDGVAGTTNTGGGGGGSGPGNGAAGGSGIVVIRYKFQ